MYYIVGLGNPGAEHAQTRHNTGRIVLGTFLKKHRLPALVCSAKYVALTSSGTVDGEDVLLLLPETYMNKSGSSVAKIVTSKKKATMLIVVYDDIDLPLGSIKISYGRGSGGHRGIESIARTLKTKDFIRVRVGITPTTPTGKLKKPRGEKNVIDFLLSDFKKAEQEVLGKVSQEVSEVISTIVTEGLEKAMNRYN